MSETLVKEGQVLESTTVQIYRTATVVKGGRRFSFGALVVVGDRQGNVGSGYGKAPGVPAAIEKAQKEARKKLVKVTLEEGTLPHEVTARFGASTVKLLPAAPGTGVVAGATVRTVLELAGVRDCLTKSFGSNNQKNLLKATFHGLSQLRSKQDVVALRGVDLEMTEVEQRLEAGRRFAPSAPAATVTAPAPPKPSKPGTRGRSSKGGANAAPQKATAGPEQAPLAPEPAEQPEPPQTQAEPVGDERSSEKPAQ